MVSTVTECKGKYLPRLKNSLRLSLSVVTRRVRRGVEPCHFLSMGVVAVVGPLSLFSGGRETQTTNYLWPQDADSSRVSLVAKVGGGGRTKKRIVSNDKKSNKNAKNKLTGTRDASDTSRSRGALGVKVEVQMADGGAGCGRMVWWPYSKTPCKENVNKVI